MPSSSSKKKTLIKLKDVAAEAEVSVATVSLALRNHPSITEETRRRVFEAKRRLGYRPIRKRNSSFPKPAAARPPGGDSAFLYCVVDFPTGKIQYAEFLNGVMNACRERNIRLELNSLSFHEAPAADLEAMSPAKGVDGVILTGMVQQELADSLLSRGINVVVLGNYNVSGIHTVEVDTFRMGESIAQRIHEEGHRVVAHLMRFPKSFYERQFLMGLRDGLAQGGVDLPDAKVFRVEHLAGSVMQTASRIMAATPRIEAVASNTPDIAVACMNEIRALKTTGKRRLPEFYSVSTLSGEVPPRHCRFLLSPGERCGRLAVEKLCHIRNQPTAFPHAIVVQATEWRGY